MNDPHDGAAPPGRNSTAALAPRLPSVLRLLPALLCAGVLSFGVSPTRAQAPAPDTARADSAALAYVRLDSAGVIDSIRAALIDSITAAQTAVEPDAAEAEDASIEELVPEAALIRGSDSLRRLGVPVVFEGDTLFRVYRGVGSFTAAQRAQRVTARIAELSFLPRAQMDSLRVEPTETGTWNVLYEDDVVNSVTEEDALAINSTTEAVARRNRAIITAVLIRAYEQRSLLTTLRDIGIFLALTVLLVLVWAGIVKFFHWLQNVLQQRLKRYMSRRMVSGGQSQFYKLFHPRAQLRALLFLVRVVRGLVLLLVLYLYLPLLFSQLSFTRGFGEKLLSFVLEPLAYAWHGILGFLPELFFILVIVWLAEQLADFVTWLGNRLQTGELQLEGFYADWAKPTANLIRALIYIFTLVIVWPLLPGSGSPAFQGVSVFVGLLLSLGGASTVGNAVSGVILTYMRPFQIGHRVKLGDAVGDIVSKNLLVTRIRTTKNEEITVPNGNLLSGGIVNYTSLAQTHGLVLHTSITIGYDVPWPQVHELLIAAAAKTPGVEAEPAPFVLQKALQDWYVEYELNAVTRDSHSMPRMYSELHANIQDGFRDAGVEIMSSHYMHVRTGNETTIPGRG